MWHRTVFASLPHFHSTFSQWKNLILQQISTSQARETCGMLGHSCSSPVLYADVVTKRIVLPTRNCPWYSSVPLNQSTWHQTMLCRARGKCRCCTNGQRDSCQHSVCPVENVLGRVPLIPCYMAGNTHPTIPFCMRGKNLGEATADSRPDSRTGSKLFEVNVWLWKYGRSLPRKCTVEEAEDMRRKRLVESRKRGAATAKRRQEAREGAAAE